MLVYVAEQILALASLGFLRNPDGLGFPGSRDLSQYESAANPELFSGTGIHIGVVFSEKDLKPVILSCLNFIYKFLSIIFLKVL